jgi:hypothetical protein
MLGGPHFFTAPGVAEFAEVAKAAGLKLASAQAAQLQG